MFAKHLPCLAMRKTENLLFDDMKGHLLLGGLAEAFSKFLGIENGVHEKAQVVQQSSQVSFFRLRILDFLCHPLRDQSAAERMPPERVRLNHPLIFGDNSINTQTEQHGAYSLQAKSHDRGTHGFALAPSVEGRIGQAQALHRDRPIVRDQLNHFFQFDFLGRQSSWSKARKPDVPLMV